MIPANTLVVANEDSIGILHVQSINGADHFSLEVIGTICNPYPLGTNQNKIRPATAEDCERYRISEIYLNK